MRILGKVLIVFSLLIGAVPAARSENACGSRLPENAVFKLDLFPGIAVIKPTEIDGAPNFRQVDSDPVYGTGQPTVKALEKILSKVGASQKLVLWLNMREEPFLYINGRPYVLRDSQHPFQNLAAVATTADEARRTEDCLKKELNKKAAQQNGMVDLFDETPDGKIVGLPEKMESVETVSEVFADMNGSGFKVDFRRIPVEDEKAPEPGVVQALLKVYSEKSVDEPLVVNCQAGKGRTTTALAVYYISGGMDADAGIDKVAAAQNLRDVIARQKNPQKQQDFQKRYDLLKSLAARMKPPQAPDVKLPAAAPDFN